MNTVETPLAPLATNLSQMVRTPKSELKNGDYSYIVLNHREGKRDGDDMTIGNRNGGRIDGYFDALVAGEEFYWKDILGDEAEYVLNRFLKGEIHVSAYTVFVVEKRVVRYHCTHPDSKPLTYAMIKRLSRDIPNCRILD